MTFKRIDQVLAGFAEGDAISNETRILQDLFRSWGLESDIFVDWAHVSPDARERSRPLAEYHGRAGDVVIHHYSIASPAVGCFMASPARRVLIYHNITPATFYRGFDDRVADQLDQARGELQALLPQVDACWADSEFNAAELRAMGAQNALVFPLLFSPEQFDLAPDPNLFPKFAAPMQNLLYVGRIAPNKQVEDLITAFAWYHRVINRQSRLIIVGSERSCPRYYLMLRMLANELELPNVCFERFASPRGLSAYYELADLFITASRHEGYCLPLVEAMHKRLPVIARNEGGMPEALGGGGVLYEDLAPGELAALIERVLTDAALKNQILAAQDQRMADLRNRDAAAELRTLLAHIG
ncbi:MAG: glycosyltransferase [Verrucomicrobia bacterium]|nr:glycosyltransferase [Verrucomicrobiota bacterium]MBT7069253.1 glycosyltransferase [Verrucomicrobiota bacterium]MBT7701995.1 glycosyltransferase [Verrucomicrobiota bacterium]